MSIAYLTCSVAFGLLLALGFVPAHALTTGEVAAWREDLRFIEIELPSVHPDLFHALSEEEFLRSISQLEQRLPELTPSEAVIELASIIASIGDGHTRLTLPMADGSGFFTGHSSTPAPTDESLILHYLPVKLALYDDGLFVARASQNLERLVGARVERIGNLSSAQALERVERVIHHDNEWQVRSLAPSRLAVPEILHALGVTNEVHVTELGLRLADGTVEAVELESVAPGTSITWKDGGIPEPLYLRNRELNFWFTPLADGSVVFCQYNEVYDDEAESIAGFAQRLTDYIDSESAEALVLDLRFNRGGDNSLNRSFLHALLRCDALQHPGTFYVIIGRNTFSAAMMFALDLEKHTPAIFVGEPTGARPNHFGDSKRVRLPNTGLTVRVSSLYWQYAGPRDERAALNPSLRTGLTSEDIRQGKDPALDRVLDILSTPPSGTLAGTWTGRVLRYEMLFRIELSNGQWAAALDLPGEGIAGLELREVGFEGGAFSFELPNGAHDIRFEGSVYQDTIIGRVVDRDQSHPLVLIRSLRP